jgi:hypothetical protein
MSRTVLYDTAATGTSDLAAVARFYARCGHDNEESRASATPDENAVVRMGFLPDAAINNTLVHNQRRAKPGSRMIPQSDMKCYYERAPGNAAADVGHACSPWEGILTSYWNKYLLITQLLCSEYIG